MSRWAVRQVQLHGLQDALLRALVRWHEGIGGGELGNDTELWPLLDAYYEALNRCDVDALTVAALDLAAWFEAAR